MSTSAATGWRIPGVVPMVATAAVSRLPLASYGLAVLVHVERLTGSFTAAGVASGALALGQGLAGPLLGRIVDRHGQTRVLVAAALVASAALGTLAALPAGSPVATLVALALVLGGATPPVGACLRALLAVVVPAGALLRRTYAADAAVTELTWVSAPPLLLLVVTVWDSRVAVTALAAVLAVSTLAFAALPASRTWRRPDPDADTHAGARRSPGSALGSAAMRTLVLVLVGVGVLFGATEVAVTAAAATLGTEDAAGPVLGLWGIGSFLGGIAATRYGTARTGPGLALLLGALSAGHLALVPATGSVAALAVTIVPAGALIAPILAATYAMVDEAAPEGMVTEAFAWIATASAVGSAAGAALAGAVIDAVGPAAAFAFAGGAGGLAAILAVARRATLAPRLPSAVRPSISDAEAEATDTSVPPRQTGNPAIERTS